jgi:hypothetical protein
MQGFCSVYKYMIFQPQLRAWKSYNCCNAALGAVLQARKHSWPALCLNAAWDFYLNTAATGMDMAGVYDKTEHPQAQANLWHNYQLRCQTAETTEWQRCRDKLHALCENALHPFVLVRNTACTHIPRSGRATTTRHYLICTGINKEKFTLFDSFLDKQVIFTEAQLQAAMQQVPGNAAVESYGLCWLPMQEDPVQQYTIHELVSHNFFTCLGASAFQAPVICNEEALLHLRGLLAATEPVLLPTVLQFLAESFRYVQYQRKYFAAAVETIAGLFPEKQAACNALSMLANGVSDEWFRFRVRALYNLQKQLPNPLQGLEESLNAIYQKEKTARQQIQAFKQDILNYS